MKEGEKMPQRPRKKEAVSESIIAQGASEYFKNQAVSWTEGVTQDMLNLVQGHLLALEYMRKDMPPVRTIDAYLRETHYKFVRNEAERATVAERVIATMNQEVRKKANEIVGEMNAIIPTFTGDDSPEEQARIAEFRKKGQALEGLIRRGEGMEKSDTE